MGIKALRVQLTGLVLAAAGLEAIRTLRPDGPTSMIMTGTLVVCLTLVAVTFGMIVRLRHADGRRRAAAAPGSRIIAAMPPAQPTPTRRLMESTGVLGKTEIMRRSIAAERLHERGDRHVPVPTPWPTVDGPRRTHRTTDQTTVKGIIQ